jgi:hypothetical protein
MDLSGMHSRPLAGALNVERNTADAIGGFLKLTPDL